MSVLTQIDRNIFRAYDIRGIVDQSLTTETIYLIGQALGSTLLEEKIKQIYVARDGRTSSPSLAKSLCEGLLTTGIDVIDLGMVPTPVLYYATHVGVTSSGVMLTGSHNPANYNGLKIVMNGGMLTNHRIQMLYERIIEKRFIQGEGSYQTYDMVNSYIEQITKDVHLARPFTIVIDAGNGVAGEIAPRLFKALGCKVYELFCEVDGRFPNHHPDPTQIENMQALRVAIEEYHADIGLGFDGDGDRLGAITNKGKMIFPDRLLMLFARTILTEQSSLPKKIIYDVKCTNHLAPLIRSLNGEPIMWKTGHSFIKEKLAETKAQLAGEMSGHFFFNDRWFGFDDALYAGARLLEILANHAESSDEVFAAIPNSVNTSELKVQVAEEHKFNLMQRLIETVNTLEAHEITTIDGLRINYENGWGLVRPSNTTPCLILRFEANTEMMLQKIQDIFKKWMLSVEPSLSLPF